MITREQLQGEATDNLLRELFNEGVKCGRNYPIDSGQVTNPAPDQTMAKSIIAEVLQRTARAKEMIGSLQRQLHTKEGMIAELRKCAEAAERQLQRKPKGGPVDGQAGEAD